MCVVSHRLASAWHAWSSSRVSYRSVMGPVWGRMLAARVSMRARVCSWSSRSSAARLTGVGAVVAPWAGWRRMRIFLEAIRRSSGSLPLMRWMAVWMSCAFGVVVIGLGSLLLECSLRVKQSLRFPVGAEGAFSFAGWSLFNCIRTCVLFVSAAEPADQDGRQDDGKQSLRFPVGAEGAFSFAGWSLFNCIRTCVLFVSAAEPADQDGRQDDGERGHRVAHRWWIQSMMSVRVCACRS